MPAGDAFDRLQRSSKACGLVPKESVTGAMPLNRPRKYPDREETCGILDALCGTIDCTRAAKVRSRLHAGELLGELIARI